MGGFNNQNRFGASAPYTAAAQYPSQQYQPNSNEQYYMGQQQQYQQEKVGYSALPEYRLPKDKMPAPRNMSSPGQQQIRYQRPSIPAPQQHTPETGMNSPTLSNSSSSGKDTASSTNSSMAQYHNNPYNADCGHVAYQHHQYEPQFPPQEQQQQQWQQNPQQTYGTPYQEISSYNAVPPSPGSAVVEEQYPQYENVAPQKTQLPYGTLHGSLENYVSFVPYPSEEFVNPNKEPASAPGAPVEGTMSRVFLGQLPYQVTDMQLDWLCFTFGNGGAVHFPERITKHDPMRGCKVPTGCIHAYANNDCVAAMLSAMHKRVLVDDTGVWFAATPDEQNVLNDYCLMMKNDRTKRYQNRPYDTVVAQFATSNFVRRR